MTTSTGTPKILITGATGQVGSKTIDFLLLNKEIEIVAAIALTNPEAHSGQTYRLGYDAITYPEMAALMTDIIGKPFRYEALSPEVFLRTMQDAGAEMAYMGCVYDHWKRYAAGTIPGADDTFDNFPDITGKQPTKWAGFIEKHKAKLYY